MNLNEYTHIIFDVEHYNPLGVIRSLGEEGIRPIAIILKSKYRVASRSKYISKLHLVDTLEDGYKVLISEYNKPGQKKTFIYTCSDKSEAIIDMHYDQLKDNFYFFNAGKTGRVSYYMDKENISSIAQKHGLDVLPINVTDNGVVPKGVEYPVITKSISSLSGGWKNDVFICHDEVELINAFKKIKAKKVIIQKYIEKKNEYCVEGISVSKGNDIFLAILSTYNYLLPDRYSPYMTVRNHDNPELEAKLREVFSEIGFEGIYEVELLIDQNEKLYFSEINFRNSTWSYAATCAGMNLPVLWAESMINGKIVDGAYKKIPDNFTAMVETNDFHVRVIGKKMSFFKWLKDLKNSNCKYYIGKNDIKPFISSLISRI